LTEVRALDVERTIRLSVVMNGDVQGVGCRPYVVRCALRLGLSGWVRNTTDGVQIEVQGPADRVRVLVEELRAAPAPIRVRTLRERELPEVPGQRGFLIGSSLEEGAPAPVIPPDLATCPDCLAEVLDPSARRAGYAFTTCTRCGPRYTIFQAFPFDRERTAMVAFPLCPACREEYEDPQDRRYHAQAVACADCGPQLRLLGSDLEPLAAAIGSLRAGHIIALKGLGGFQLLCDARDEDAVQRLRRRKGRPAKPLALMFPSLEGLARACHVDEVEAGLLRGATAPIVLLRPRATTSIAPSVHPGAPRIGAMLPTTPLHTLLLQRLGGPVVCTSGNRSEEPICTEGSEAMERLGPIADLVVDHDRPVLRPVDDSVMRVIGGRPVPLRRARGQAPRPIPLPAEGPPILALGAHLKNTVGLALGAQAVLSPHVGDLDERLTVQRFEEAAAELCRGFGVHPVAIACDLHPDYRSTRHAEELAARYRVPLVRVQHHHAHVAAVVAEHELRGPVLGLAWDGTGHGSDGTAWGGEALLLPDVGSFERVATLRGFRLAGGDAAARQPARTALGLLSELEGTEAIPGAAEALARIGGVLGERTLGLLQQMLATGTGSPITTAMGRLFDGVAFLAGLRGRCSYEAQAAIELEAAAERGLEAGEDRAYPLPCQPGAPMVADWRPTVIAVLRDRERGVDVERIAARFHLALADLGAALAARHPRVPVALSGGCFQNGVLVCEVTQRILADGGVVHTPWQVPPNDGGLALGQLAVARSVCAQG